MDEQIRSYLETLEAVPGDVRAFHALEAIYQKSDRWDELLKLYEGRAQNTATPEDVRTVLQKAAELARTRLGNRARAEELYRKVLESDPHHGPALESLTAIHEEKGDW